MGYHIYPTTVHGISDLSHDCTWDIRFITRGNLIPTDAKPTWISGCEVG